MYRFCCMKVFFFLYGFLILLKKKNIWAIKLLSINVGFELPGISHFYRTRYKQPHIFITSFSGY